MPCREQLAQFGSRLREFGSRLGPRLRSFFTQIRMTQSRDDLRKLTFWKAVSAEFIGTLFFVMIGCGSWTETDQEEHPITVRIALGFGLTYAIVLYCIRNISGGHANPAVTLAMLVTRKISIARSVLYMVAQCLGAILGAALLYAFTSWEYRTKLGCTFLSRKVTPEQGFGIEFFATFLLVFVVFAAYDKGRKEPCPPFIIGVALVACSMWAVPYTGGSLNTARSFGPAVVKGFWTHHWVYWFGPMIGGTLGGIVYDTVCASNASIARMRRCILVKNECASDPTKKPKTATPAAVTVEENEEPERQALKQDTSISIEEPDECEVILGKNEKGFEEVEKGFEEDEKLKSEDVEEMEMSDVYEKDDDEKSEKEVVVRKESV